MQHEISLGKSYAVQILVANELGLTKKGVDYAKLYLQDKLFAMQFSQLEIAASEAVKAIQVANKIDEADALALKYLKQDASTRKDEGELGDS